MSTPAPHIRELARRLVAFETARSNAQAEGGSVGVRVCEKFRVPLVNLAGVAGFFSLMSRALALAKAELPSLEGVCVRPDGTLEGFNGIEWNEDTEAGLVVACLLKLLVTFIGERLTLDLVCEVWPDAAKAGSGEEL